MKTNQKYFTDKLFRRTSALKGAGSVMNIAGNYFLMKYAHADTVIDIEALENDWGVVGQDIKSVLKSPGKDLAHK